MWGILDLSRDNESVIFSLKEVVVFVVDKVVHIVPVPAATLASCKLSLVALLVVISFGSKVASWSHGCEREQEFVALVNLLNQIFEVSLELEPRRPSWFGGWTICLNSLGKLLPLLRHREFVLQFRLILRWLDKIRHWRLLFKSDLGFLLLHINALERLSSIVLQRTLRCGISHLKFVYSIDDSGIIGMSRDLFGHRLEGEFVVRGRSIRLLFSGLLEFLFKINV